MNDNISTELNRTFSKEEVQMAQKKKKETHMKKCSPFPATIFIYIFLESNGELDLSKRQVSGT
jgi:hypothetical protein